MLNNYMQKKGFTLVELLVVIFIISLISGLTIIGLTSYKYNQVHKLDVQTTLSILNSARVKAGTGQNARDYNVVIDSTAKTMTLNLVSTDISDPTDTETVELDSHTVISGTVPTTIVFDRFTGSTANTGTIVLTTSVTGFSRATTITIYPTGLAATE